MFAELPEPFHKTPFLDRIHGFIKGWELPRMNDDMKANGWALNSEYYSRTEGHPGQRRYALSGKVICGCCGTEYKRFAGARQSVSTTELLPVAATLASPAAADDIASTEANTLPAALLSASNAVENSGVDTALPLTVDTSSAENSSPRNAGAVWKCKARVSRKDAASAYQRISTATAANHSTAATPGGEAGGVVADGHSRVGGGNGTDIPRVANGEAEDGEAIPTPSRDGLIWRCDNKIIDEHTLQLAVDRALSLLPREEANIRLIQDECLRVMALPTPANATPSSPSAACEEHSSDDAHTAAQILLLHTETALSYLSGSTSSQWVGTGMTGRSSRDALPCTTFQQFVERSSVWLPSISPTVGNGREEDDAIDLLIDRVVIDGDKVRVVFKAGVEI